MIRVERNENDSFSSIHLVLHYCLLLGKLAVKFKHTELMFNLSQNLVLAAPRGFSRLFTDRKFFGHKTYTTYLFVYT